MTCVETGDKWQKKRRALHQLDLRLDSKREKEIYGRLWLALLEYPLNSPLKMQKWTCACTNPQTNRLKRTAKNWSTGASPLSFSFFIVSVSQVKCSHSYVTSVVWLWHLTVTKGILTFKGLHILPMNPNSHTAKIWSGLSKCRNISGIPEEMCSGSRFNQEKAAELAQICHHKNVFLAQTLPWEVLTKFHILHFHWWGD